MGKPEGYKEIKTETNSSNIFFLRYLNYAINQQNLNNIIVIVGRTGSGKSYAGISFAEMTLRAGISKKFDVSHIHFKAEGFIEHLEKRDENGAWLLGEGDCIIFDEAGVAISSREWFSLVNKRVMNVLETFRWRKLITIFTVPDISFIDSKARRLVNMLFEPRTIIKRQNICVIKPLMISWDKKKADKMYTPYLKYKNPIDGQEYRIQNLFLPKPSAKLRHEYDKKKEKYASELTHDVLMEVKLLKIKQKLNSYQKKIFDIMHREKDYNYNTVSEILGISPQVAYKNLKYIHYVLGKDYNEEPPVKETKS